MLVPHVGENTSVFTGNLARLQCPITYYRDAETDAGTEMRGYEAETLMPGQT